MRITINKPTEFEAIYLKVDAGVRYWQDSRVNGNHDTCCDETSDSPNMPCAEYIGGNHNVLRGKYWRWQPLIEIETGKIVNWQQGITANIHYKVCDDFACEILDGNKEVITSYDDYVPKVMCPKEDGYGDYIIMDIDGNGFIQGWRKDLISRIIELEED